MKTNPFTTPVKRGTLWSPTRVGQELTQLRALPFFKLAGHSVMHECLHVTGTLASNQPETGRTQSLQVRMEYPVGYPWNVPRVFDEDRRFRPSADGHLFSNYGLCLSFPLREEFSLGSDALGREMLGAALIWMEKRYIFERLNEWPGEAEEHGWLKPMRQVILEETNRSHAVALKAWTIWAVEELVMPNYGGGCPCCSGKPFLQCHSRLAKRLFLCLLIAENERRLLGERPALEAA